MLRTSTKSPVSKNAYLGYTMIMKQALLVSLSGEPREIDRVEREYRLRDCERLERQAETGDIRAGQERSFGPDRGLPEEEPSAASGAGSLA